MVQVSSLLLLQIVFSCTLSRPTPKADSDVRGKLELDPDLDVRGKLELDPEGEKDEESVKGPDLNLTFTFDCSDKAVGFYADKEYDCQIFHMCDEGGKRVPHACANETSFNQEFRICDWKYNFNCSEAEEWYFLNELTYATDPPTDDI